MCTSFSCGGVCIHVGVVALRVVAGQLGRDGPDVFQNTLFTGEEELFASKRCISRLNEMRSPSYLTQRHQV